LLELAEAGYCYTEKGRELAPTLVELDAWARRHRFARA
jgi:DNA-binding HxlR family transcriptional regulator